jgi:hypothetical protein
MAFGEDSWNIVLPNNLLDTTKDRLKRSLGQFFNENHRKGEKKYDGFYHQSPPNYFLQGDVIKNVSSICWDYHNNNYVFKDSPVLLISNTCDISEENIRDSEKQALYAPLVKMDSYIDSLKDGGFSKERILTIINNLKTQSYSNIFYMPPNPVNMNEYLILLDNIFWQPSSMLKAKLKDINKERFLSLDNFGFYLLITKISYHFCRVPEEIDR